MSRIRTLLCALCLLLGAAPALADPREGSFANHEVAKKYTGTVARKAFTRQPSGLLLATEPVTEDLSEFSRVEVLVTPKSRTVVEIWAIKDLASDEDSSAFYENFFAILKELYLWPCPPIVHDQGERVHFMCDRPIAAVLKLERVAPKASGEQFRVRMGLTLEPGPPNSPGWPALQKLIATETR